MDKPNHIKFTDEYLFYDSAREARRVTRLLRLAGVSSRTGEYVMLSNDDFEKLVMAIHYWKEKAANNGQNYNGPG